MTATRRPAASGLTFCSIVSKNYLAPARALAESVRAHHPGAAVHVLLLDPPDGFFRPEAEPFTAHSLDGLGLPPADVQRLRFQYTPFELSCAVKPLFAAHLLRAGARKVVYFDTDVLVLNPLGHLDALLDHHPIVLTPHLTTPYADDRHPGELAMAVSGAHNMGFFAVAKGRSADAFLAWWGRRLDRDCLHAVDRGLFVDQKWADLVPGLFDGVKVLRDPGYNVAYWNLHDREVAVRPDGVRVNGGPCYFFHFSGYDPADPETLSKYQNRHAWADLGDVRVLVDRYRAKLREHGHDRCRAWPYTWARFDNTAFVPDFVRRLYHALGADAARFGDPFAAAGPDSFFRWLTATPHGGVPPALKAIYDTRPDLRAALPDVAGKDRDGLLHWWRHHGQSEYQLDPPILDALAAPPAPAVTCRPGGGYVAGRPGPVLEAFGANVLGFFQSEKGMGEACRATVRAATAAGVPVALNNWVDGGSANVDGSLTGFAADNPYPVNLIHLNADATPWLLDRIPGYFEGRYNIGYWNWELEWFPEQWHDHFRHYDEVWTPSRFTREAVARVSPVPVHRIPFAVTAPAVPRRLLCRDRFGLPPAAFVFLFAFDFHSHFARKNPLAVVEAFRRAFGRRRDVHLLIKSSRAETAPREFAEVLAACGGQPNIRLMRDVLARDELCALMSVCDAYTALHRSEGYGLPIAEAMALGKPVVATGYSANVDFMDDSNSFPVRYDRMHIQEDYGPYRKGAVWADPDVGHAAEQMRRVVTDPVRTARIAARAAADIARTLNPAVVGGMIRDRLRAIHGRDLPAAPPAVRRSA